jgi:hypothetical protein
MMGVQGNEPDKYMIPKWERGVYIEQWYQDALMSDKFVDEAGYNFRLLGCNVKFEDPVHRVRGEFDGVGIIDGEPVGIEFKTIGAWWEGVQETISGYNATAKETAMLQVMRYLHWTQDRYIKLHYKVEKCEACNGVGSLPDYDDTGEEYGYRCDVCRGTGRIKQQWAEECKPEEIGAMQIKKFRILYWMSGEKFSEYEIQLGSNDELVMYYWDRNDNKTRKIFADITIERILKRQKELFEYISKVELPPKDYAPKNLEKYEIINSISSINRKIGAAGRRKGITDPSACTPEKVKDDMAHMSNLQKELADEQRKLKRAFHNWRAGRWMIHPPKYENWCESKKHVGDWQCRETICPYRELCDKDWNLPKADNVIFNE